VLAYALPKQRVILTTSKKHSKDCTKRCNKLCTPVLLPHMQLMLELAEDPDVHYYYLADTQLQCL
jgi:hypothetical protein